MRLTYTFSALVLAKNSGTEVLVPASFDGWRATEDRLEKYLDPDVADSGVIGGEISGLAKNRQARLEVIYWLPNVPTNDLIERLRAETIAQLDDGIGEGGFEFDADGELLVVTADTHMPVSVETVDDGRSIPNPSRIAIAARDGDLSALVAAIEIDRGGIEKLHQGYSALQLAILYGHVEAVRILLAAGADPNRLDPEGLTPLELCALSNSIDDEQSRQLAQLLLDAGAKPHHIAPHGESAKSYAESRGKSRMAEIL